MAEPEGDDGVVHAAARTRIRFSAPPTGVERGGARDEEPEEALWGGGPGTDDIHRGRDGC